jgi:adenylate kinase family enzyme
MKIIWLTGKTCVGKSTYADSLARDSRYVHVLHLGKLCRARVGEEAMARSDNPTTPSETEDMVRLAIEQRLWALGSDETLVVDSFPRSLDQILWLKKLAESRPKIEHEVIYMVCDEEEREKRIQTRSKDPVDAKLIRARLDLEDPVFLQVLGHLLTSGLRVSITNLANGRTLRSNDSDQTNLDFMFTAHAEFVDESMKRIDARPNLTEMQDLARWQTQIKPLHPSSVWLVRYLTQAQVELGEALEQIPSKWWSVDRVDLAAVRVEIIDAWHFVMSAAMACGLDAASFSRLYYEKRQVNLQRAMSGTYSANNKTEKDDGHLGHL